MRTPKVFCKQCGKPLVVGSEAVEIEEYAEGIYCSEKCAREALHEAVDEIYQSIATDVTIEDEDPYARYGVYRSDF